MSPEAATVWEAIKMRESRDLPGLRKLMERQLKAELNYRLRAVDARDSVAVGVWGTHARPQTFFRVRTTVMSILGTGTLQVVVVLGLVYGIGSTC